MELFVPFPQPLINIRSFEMKQLSQEILDTYKLWQSDERFDKATRDELNANLSNEEIEDRFWRDLEFGTGGLRGVMGAGTNRMNKYIIRKATQGFANYLKDKYGNDVVRGVAIGYDSRNNSDAFAKEAALVMAKNGIPSFLYDELMPTPTLSFTTRELGCVGGIVVTASHNPKEYNGYKVYDETGCQVLIDDANAIIGYVNAIVDIPAIEVMDESEAREKGLLKSVPEAVYNSFIENVKKQSHEIGEKSAKIVYWVVCAGGSVFSGVLVLSEPGCPGITIFGPRLTTILIEVMPARTVVPATRFWLMIKPGETVSE